jgi:hypothetical protein
MQKAQTISSWFYHSVKGNDQGTSTITKGNDSSTWRGSKKQIEAVSDLIKAEVNVKNRSLDDASGVLVKQIKPI